MPFEHSPWGDLPGIRFLPVGHLWQWPARYCDADGFYILRHTDRHCRKQQQLVNMADYISHEWGC